jgi:glutamate/aspartate transport system permease protein
VALDWEVFCKDTISGEVAEHCLSSIFGGGSESDPTYLDWLMSAWGWTILVAALSLFLALVLGTLIGTLRTIPSGVKGGRWLVLLATIWVEVFRNIPVLVQVFVWYHVVPAVFPVMKAFPSYWLVSIALGLYTSARIAEQVRAGIQSLPSGQRAAGVALGLSTFQVYRFVILPMGLRIVIPPLTSECMNLVKNSSVAFAVSVPELTMFAMQAQEETSRGIEIYLVVTALYALSAFAVNRVMTWIERRTRVPGFIAPASSTSTAHQDS